MIASHFLRAIIMIIIISAKTNFLAYLEQYAFAYKIPGRHQAVSFFTCNKY